MTETRDPMAPDGAVNPIDTDYKVGQDNIIVNVGPFGLDIHNRVFAISGLLVVAFVVLTLAFQNQVEPMFTAMRGWLTSNLDWFFISAGNVFVLVCLGLAISPLGKVRLGGTEATPDYTYLGWFSMLFAAGMGIGLMFFGVSEPLSHFGSAFGGTAMENGVRTDWAPLGAAAGDAEAATRLGAGDPGSLLELLGQIDALLNQAPAKNGTAAINDWNSMTILNISSVSSGEEIYVFNANSGATGWAGLARITLDFNLLDFQTMAGIPRMNTTNSMEVSKAMAEREIGITLFGTTTFSTHTPFVPVEGQCSATLGTARDAQIIDALQGEYKDTFMLHYNFPPYSVGETGRMGSPGRREIGHGKLAWRAIHPMLPPSHEFPYTIRVVSEITESNGSSSMASVCGSSLALMDAGVPIKGACAGVAMGLIKEGNRVEVLTDILGMEDALAVGEVIHGVPASGGGLDSGGGRGGARGRRRFWPAAHC